MFRKHCAVYVFVKDSGTAMYIFLRYLVVLQWLGILLCFASNCCLICRGDKMNKKKQEEGLFLADAFCPLVPS